MLGKLVRKIEKPLENFGKNTKRNITGNYRYIAEATTESSSKKIPEKTQI